MSRGLLAALLLVPAWGCEDEARPKHPPKSPVIVMGMIHGGHRTNPRYSIEVLKKLIRAIKPDFILAEIPPDRLAVARAQFEKTGKITEPRVRVFPEYTDAVFPLTREMKFTLVGCAGWTQAMSDDRQRKLKRWRTERTREYKEMAEAQRRMQQRLRKEELDQGPRGIHTDRYDRIVQEGLEPYNRLFNKDLGAGGWDNINAAHYANIARALDGHRGEGKRFLIMFGAWHKHWFKNKLRRRTDIELISLQEFLK